MILRFVFLPFAVLLLLQVRTRISHTNPNKPMCNDHTPCCSTKKWRIPCLKITLEMMSIIPTPGPLVYFARTETRELNKIRNADQTLLLFQSRDVMTSIFEYLVDVETTYIYIYIYIYNIYLNDVHLTCVAKVGWQNVFPWSKSDASTLLRLWWWFGYTDCIAIKEISAHIYEKKLYQSVIYDCDDEQCVKIVSSDKFLRYTPCTLTIRHMLSMERENRSVHTYS